MQDIPQENLFVIGICLAVAAILGLFIFIYVLGMRSRKRGIQTATALTGEDIMAAAPEYRAQPEECLYAVLHDFSFTEGGYLFRDFKNNQVGLYHCKMKPSLFKSDHRLEVGGETFRVRTLDIGLNTVEVGLFRGEEAETPVAKLTARQKLLRRDIAFDYDGNTLHCKTATQWQALWDSFTRPCSRVAEVMQSTEKIGALQRLNTQGYPLILTLPQNIPLHIRLFMMTSCTTP